MKFKLLGENNYDINPIETIFFNRGVQNVEHLLNVSEKDVIHYSKLINIEKAVDCLLSHIHNNSEIFIQVDSDCDGFSSSTILINYLKYVFGDINIKWRLHDGKQHGIKIKDIPSSTKLVIIPDAGTNQFEEHKELHEKGIDVIVLDHHESESESEFAIIVNNQLSPEYRNKALSGAGIVYKFCKALDNRLGKNHADYYLDLVAVGNIGDMVDLREIETRYFVKKGLEQIHNPLLKEIIIKQDYSMKSTVNIHNVAFYVVPLINAAVRAATHEEKIRMMEAFLGSEELVYYSRGDKYETIQVATARSLVNIRSRQNKPKDKSVPIIEQLIIKNGLLDNKIFVLDVTDILDKSLTGLVANQIARKYKRPTILLREVSESIYGGSARGMEKGEVKDLKKFLSDSKLFNFCEGHGNAFGVEINKENIQLLIDYIDKNLHQEIELDSYEVDFVINIKDLKTELIAKIAGLKNEWGSTIQEPKIAITNLCISKHDVKLYGKKRNILKIQCNGIEFVRLFFNENKLKDIFGESETYYLDIVGTCNLNEWNGKTTPQINIEELEITDALDF